MRAAIALAVVALAAGSARAEDPAAFAALGVGALHGGGAQWLVDAGYQPVDRVPIRVRVMFVEGEGDAQDGNYGYTQVRGGIEAAACRTHAFCGLIDVDAGMLRVHANELGVDDDPSLPATDRDGLLLGARIGFDTGGHLLRFRLMLDLAGAVSGPMLVRDNWGGTEDLSKVVGAEAEIAVVF